MNHHKKCDYTCATQRRYHCRELSRINRTLLVTIGLEDVNIHLSALDDVDVFSKKHKDTQQVSGNWSGQEFCNWCKGSRVDADFDPSKSFNGVPEPPVKESKKKFKSVETLRFDFEAPEPRATPPDTTTTQDQAAALNLATAALNSYFSMPNTMFPPWPMVLNNQTFPTDRLYSQSSPNRPPLFDAEAMQRYTSDWQNQLLSSNMMPLFMRAPGTINPAQLNMPAAAAMLVAQQAAFLQHLQTNANLCSTLNSTNQRPFLLKDPPKKEPKISNSSENGSDMPLDLSAKSQQNSKTVEDDQVSSAASADLNDKSSSPEFSEPGVKLNKRTYTQQALNSAVSEIMSGRLGTRRASVVYGIPRSTLRNKIYKLESIDELNGEVRKRKTKKVEECSSASLKTTKEEDESALLLQKTQSMPTINSPSMLPLMSLGSNGNILPALPHFGGTLNSFTDFFKHYTEKKVSNGTKEGSMSSPTENSGDEMEKRPRPKRGQYRKYDKDALENAVLSVRKGEMSVHRAGSFYGVPHSTLEYKVKERYLMRPKRKTPPEAKKDKDSAGESAESLVISTDDSIKTISSGDESSNAVSTSVNEKSDFNIMSIIE